nr:hypothetical protein [Halopiger aswanensis]
MGRDLGRIDAVGQRDHRALVGLEVLGEAAVGRKPVERRVLAVHVLAEPTGPADTAGLDGVTDHRIALLDQRDLLARLGDDARVLVTQRHRQVLGGVVGPHPLDDVVVRLAPARALDLDQHLIGALEFRAVDVVDLQRLAHVLGVLVESSCLHGSTPHFTAHDVNVHPASL